MNEPLLLALDLGISSIKAALVRPDGTILAIENAEHLILPEGEAYVEFSPEAYWQTIAAAIRAVVAGSPGQVVALAISSHGETLFCLDDAGEPTRPAILTLDARAEVEAAALTARYGDRVQLVTGQPDVLPIWPAAKLAWLRLHEPDAFARTAHYLLPQGYAVWRLCGRYADDPSVMASSMLVDVEHLSYWGELVDHLGVSERQLPAMLPPGSIAGWVSRRAAADTGLPRHTAVVIGALDQLCGAVGAGNVRPGVVSECTGSVLALVATTAKPVLRPGAAPCYPHAVPGLYCLLPWHMTGGLALKWLRDRFAPGEDYAALSAEAATVPAGAEGMLALPHLEGTQFPDANASVRGVFFGAGLKHGRKHFVRALMEGVAFTIRQDLESLAADGIVAGEIASFGGGARSEVWLQIKADVTGLPVRTQGSEQTALVGAAAIAAVGARLHPDVPSAAAAMMRGGRLYRPDPRARLTYDAGYARYLALTRALAPLFR